MDMQMPGMDGLHASGAICARWPTSERPRIIAMTAGALEADRESCLAAGMDDYLVKPVTLDQLRGALGETRLHSRPVQAGEDDILSRDLLRQLREDVGAAETREVIEAFLESAPRLLASLGDGVARADTIAIQRAAHTLKASSATLGALDLSRRCEELERLCRAGERPRRCALLQS